MRRRARIRQKALVVDDTTTVDLTAYEPPIELRTRGQFLWMQLAGDPPFWWTEQDLPTAAMLCAATDATGDALDDPDQSAAGKAALLKEWRSLAGELGLSPTSRGRLKLTEAQGVAAAKKIEQMDADNKRKQTAAVDIDELMGDG